MRKVLFLFLPVFGFLFLCTTMYGSDNESIETISNYLKATVSDITAQEMNEMMVKHYQQLRLIDEKGSWKHPGLEAISQDLLPGNIDRTATFSLIDHMALAAGRNEYLTDFLNRAQNETFADYMTKVQEEGDVVLPDVIAYAHVLERLNRAMRNNWKILELCKDIWEYEREIAKVKDHMDLFEHAKLASVEHPVKQFIKIHKAGYVDPKFMRGMLPLNIMEAVAVDAFDGMGDNAYAGGILAKYPPGFTEYNAATGEGPSCFSQDKKAILLNMALPKEWADLYTVWNLAFVTSYSHPYIMVKLLIPSVTDYENEPAEYIYNRGMALYTHIHFELLRRVDYINAGKDEVRWPDEHLRKFFGKVNKENAKKYDNEVKSLKSSWLEWFREKLGL